MKLVNGHELLANGLVAPLVGAWIEILFASSKDFACMVAPLVGAWIEIISIPQPMAAAYVAPLVGAWIEIKSDAEKALNALSLLL